ncbi:MAG: flavin reductase family protein [bacterium]
MNYQKMELKNAYKLINTLPVLLISTRNKKDICNIAPIAWCSPAKKEPPRIVAGIGKVHKTYRNILETKEFIAGIPHISQVEILRKTGSVSGEKTDKFKEFKINYSTGTNTGCKIPNNMIGYLECKVGNIFDTGHLALVTGEVVHAEVASEAFDFNEKRLLCEKSAGKCIYHMGGGKFLAPGDEIH